MVARKTTPIVTNDGGVSNIARQITAAPPAYQPMMTAMCVITSIREIFAESENPGVIGAIVPPDGTPTGRLRSATNHGKMHEDVVFNSTGEFGECCLDRHLPEWYLRIGGLRKNHQCDRLLKEAEPGNHC